MLREFTEADSIKKLSTKADDKSWEEAALQRPPVTWKKSPTPYTTFRLFKQEVRPLSAGSLC